MTSYVPLNATIAGGLVFGALSPWVTQLETASLLGAATTVGLITLAIAIREANQ